MILYLIKVLGVQGILFAFYGLFLRKSARHAHNRFYLLASLLLSFIIPFIHLSLPNPVYEVSGTFQNNPMITWMSDPTFVIEDLELVGEKVITSFSFWSLLPWIYGIVVVVLLARSVAYLFILRKLKKQSEPIKKEWFTLFKTSQSRSFSFFSDVFMPGPLFGSKAFEQVLAHECVHVKQLHSLDRLLLDFFVSLFWFNPFMYLYRNALIEIHEYQADEGVLKRYNDLIGYQEVLYAQLQSPQYSGLVSHFNFQMIKKRIVMMNEQKKRTGWIYVLTVPVMLMMIFAFSSKEAMQPLKNVGHEISSFIGPITHVKDYALTILPQDNSIPSILPFKETEKVRVTSSYGMCMHPIKKVKKMHLGMDFACEVGTEVLATADGEVIEIQNNPDGYGKLMIVDHGNEYQTYYAQLSQFRAKQGEQVKKGQVIALSGNSGMSTAPHLHYEVKQGNQRVDPKMYIKNYTFTIKEVKRPQIKEVKDPDSSGKDQGDVDQELLMKEQELVRRTEELKLREQELAKEAKELAISEMKSTELARREAELMAKEKELYQAKKRIVDEEVRRAQIELMKTKEMDEKQMMEDLKYIDPNEPLNISQKIKIEGLDEPLFVLDGEIMDREEISDLQPYEIDNINVLKDKSAKEKYGKKGKNGVIEINTKKKIKVKKKTKTKDSA